MSELDLFEASQLALGNALQSFAILVTMMGAYLTVAYLVAKKLSTVQITVINGIFIVSSLGMTYTIFSFTSAGLDYYHKIATDTESWLLILNVAIDLFMIAACLQFMWVSRGKDPLQGIT
jgi:hypothetical protein